MGEYGLNEGQWPGRVSPGAAMAATRSQSYRSIWISDLHLGTRRFKARELLDFLDRHEAENLYLVRKFADRSAIQDGRAPGR